MMANKFSWWIWTKKIMYQAITAFAIGGVSVWQNNPYWLALIPVLEAVRNYIKHN